MKEKGTDRIEENNDDGFNVDDFQDFASQLDSSDKEEQQEPQDKKQIAADNLEEKKRIISQEKKKVEDKYKTLIEDFILTYNNGLYFNSIKNIIQEKRESITIDYNHIIGFSDQLSDYLLNFPSNFINLFKDVLVSIDEQQDLNYFDKKKFFNIKLTNYPITEKIKNIDVNQRNKLLSMRGNISKTSDIKPYIHKYCLRCPECESEVFSDYEEKDCSMCDKRPTMKKDRDRHIYTNCMFIKIQELSEDLEGRTPHAIDCMVLGDIIKEIKPGIKATITGFVHLREILNSMSKRTPFLVSVMINNIEPFTSNDLNLIKKIYLTEKEEKKFMELSKSETWIDTLIESFAPHIYGLRNIKLGILLSIIGSGNFIVQGTDIRSRIHILICGDPSLAKTKLLKFTHKVVLGSISAIGKGASGGGLTAVVTKEKDGTFTVQPGAIVFANKSLFLFDESDKVTDDVRSHLHESMEDGTVTVTKGGQIVTLQAESTTLFAANPKYSRYQEGESIAENINLPHSLISRFDLIYLLKDTVNKELDKQITDHINYIYVNRSIPNQETLLSIEDLTKYFLFVKTQDIDPEFDQEALDLLQDFYYGMREKSTPDTIATTIRQYEGSLRLSRALARITLRKRITKSYVEMIIGLVRSQFDSVMREADGTYNSSLAEGKSKKKIYDAKLMKEVMISLESDYDDKHKIPVAAVVEQMIDTHKMIKKDAYKFLDRMNDENVISNNGEGYVRLSKYA